MRSIDVHAHLTPQCFWQATEKGGDWHTLKREKDERGQENAIVGGRRQVLPPRARWTPEERLADMDSLGVDVHVVSPYVGFYNYHLDSKIALATSRATNDEISSMTRAWPRRFAGLGTLPMQDVKAAITELERCMTQIGLKGVEINDHVNGRTLDEPEFRPFWKAAEQLGALVFFHQGGETLVSPRTKRYHLPNTVGNLVDRAVTFATLVSGGVMDECPDLKIVLGHGGGYTCFGIGRMDHGWQVRTEARAHTRQPTIAYLPRLRRLHRVGAALPDRHRGRRSRRVRHGLAVRHGARLAGLLDPRHGEPHPGGEGSHPLAQSGAAARPHRVRPLTA